MNMITRRAFVAALAGAVPVLAASRSLLARSADTGPRTLDFFHTHASERLAVEYFDGGAYLPDALATVNHFLRDFRTGDVRPSIPGCSICSIT